MNLVHQVYLILEKGSFGECEDKIEFTNTFSEFLLYIFSTPSELVALDYSIISSLGVLINKIY